MLNVKNIAELGLSAEGFYHVNDNELYEIKSDCRVRIEKNVNARIIDTSNKANIVIYVLEDSKLDYTILNSNNSERTFFIKGELDINEIEIGESNSVTKANLMKPYSIFNSKVLIINDNKNSNYEIYVNHQAKYTKSNIYNFGLSMNDANIKFDITGKINKGMSKSNCEQLSRGVVIGNSTVEAKPILLIDEYDCIAHHGASIGKMSDDDLFYLMSRGLTKNEAFFLILKGIVKPFTDRLPIDSLKDEVLESINNMIEKG